MTLIIISNTIQFAYAILTALVMRWLLELSSIEKDLAWLQDQKWYREYKRLKFYRGMEYFRQLRFKRIMRSF